MSLFLAKTLSTLVVGRSPWAPGTVGSLLAVVLWWFYRPQATSLQIIVILVAFAVGWLATAAYERRAKKHDPKEVVIDELIGMWISLLGAPQNFRYFVLGFLFFRLFDIRKPFPVGWIDRKVSGALGTIFDDVAAGVMAYFAIQLVVQLGSPIL